MDAGPGSFSDVLRAAVFNSGGIISYDNFAAFTTERTRTPGMGTAGADSGQAAVNQAPSMRDRLGDTYEKTGLPVIWDDAGANRLTPGRGNPDDIINLIYELKALGMGKAEDYWYGREQGGIDHLTGYVLLNQLKLSIMRHGGELLSPSEYQAIGRRMMENGEERNLYPDGFLYGS